MSPNLRSMLAKGAKWAVSRRSFPSSPMSVGAVFYWNELMRLKALRDNTFLMPGDEFVANSDKFLIEAVQGNSILKRKLREGELLMSAKEFMESPGDFLVNVTPKH